jgi:CRISPR-associated protein Cmr5
VTRDQERARAAFKNVASIRDTHAGDERFRKKYGSTAHALPVLVREAGLAQALAFVDSRETEAEAPTKQLLEHVARTALGESRSDLLARSREVGLTGYMYLTQEVLAVCRWYKRFAVSVLGEEQGAEEVEA